MSLAALAAAVRRIAVADRADGFADRRLYQTGAGSRACVDAGSQATVGGVVFERDDLAHFRHRAGSGIRFSARAKRIIAVAGVETQRRAAAAVIGNTRIEILRLDTAHKSADADYCD